MSGDTWTAEEITDAMHQALVARDMPAVVALWKMLAVRSPDDAQFLLDAFEATTGTTVDPTKALLNRLGTP